MPTSAQPAARSPAAARSATESPAAAATADPPAGAAAADRPAASSRRARPLPPDQRRAALVAATLPLILRRGTNVSTREIAKAAGVAEGTIFRAFPDKESLIREAVAAAFDPQPAIDELRGVDLNRPLNDRLTVIVSILQTRITTVTNLMMALGMRRPPEDAETTRRHDANQGRRRLTSEAIHVEVAKLLEPDRASLRLMPLDVARFLRLLVFSGTHPAITDGNPMSPDEIVTLLLDGVRKHKEARQ